MSLKDLSPCSLAHPPATPQQHLGWSHIFQRRRRSRPAHRPASHSPLHYRRHRSTSLPSSPRDLGPDDPCSLANRPARRRSVDAVILLRCRTWSRRDRDHPWVVLVLSARLQFAEFVPSVGGPNRPPPKIRQRATAAAAPPQPGSSSSSTRTSTPRPRPRTQAVQGEADSTVGIIAQTQQALAQRGEYLGYLQERLGTVSLAASRAGYSTILSTNVSSLERWPTTRPSSRQRPRSRRNEKRQRRRWLVSRLESSARGGRVQR